MEKTAHNHLALYAEHFLQQYVTPSHEKYIFYASTDFCLSFFVLGEKIQLARWVLIYSCLCIYFVGTKFRLRRT